MKIKYSTIGVAVVSMGLMLTTGCEDAGSGASQGGLFGGALGAIVGQATGHPEYANLGQNIGILAGGIMGEINEQQRARLQQQSPQTLVIIQHNDQVAQQEANQQTAEAPLPLAVSDIAALNSAGVKDDVIIEEIKKSKSAYSQSDIASLQQSNPNIGSAIIQCMGNTNAS